MKPLEDITVLGFNQFLSALSATLRLADLGACATKVECLDGGGTCRALYASNLITENDSSLSHFVNRSKYEVSINLKNPASRDMLWLLIRKTDVTIANFRPGVMKRLGLDYASVKQYCLSMTCGEVVGYRKKDP